MKSIAKLAVLTAVLSSVAGQAFADVRIDEAVKLQQSGTIKSFDALNEVAVKQFPGATITDTELEDAYGKYVYQVELRDAKGQEWDVDIDAASGEVLRSQQDD
jgi:uncharacterized membrane protein YkoI